MDIGIQTQSNVNVCTKSATYIPMKRCFVCGYQLPLQCRLTFGWHEVNGQLDKLFH